MAEGANDDDLERATLREARRERALGDPLRALELHRELAGRDTLIGRLAALIVVEILLDLGRSTEAREAAGTLLPLDRASYEAIAAVLEGRKPEMPPSLLSPVLVEPEASAPHWLLATAAVLIHQQELARARPLLERAAELDRGEGRDVRWQRNVIETLRAACGG